MEVSLSRPSRARVLLICVCIAMNTLTAGGIFCFPLFAPSLARHLRLSQSQLSTIVLAGMMGQYPFGTFWGMFVDRVGPWACSLSASGLFALGFGLFAHSIQKGRDAHEFSPSSYHLLVFCFFLAGLGTVASYFSCLFSASRTFPHRTGLATGVVTALFGLSPLVLSGLGSIFFTEGDGSIDAPRYLACIAIAAGSANLIGGIGLQSVPHHTHHAIPSKLASNDVAAESNPSLADYVPDERAPLLSPPLSPSGLSNSQRDANLAFLLKDTDFWLLGMIMLVCMGSAEMVISNIGTIVESLASTTISGTSAASQVRLISLANTFSRLLTGPIADFTSPIPIQHPSGEVVVHKKRAVTRVAFVSLSSSMLVLSFIWMAWGVGSGSGIWLLSIGTGAAYGMIWTVIPSLIESIWGTRNVARNFGFISYAPFIGTPIFTFLYASISDRGREESATICHGVHCWKTTFVISTSVVFVAGLGSALLWRRWGHRV